MALLTCDHVTLGYDGREVLSDLSFSVESGDYLCILGENGSGKSTLMKTLLRLIDPIRGKIIYGEGLSAGAIGYLPQQTEVQRDFPASVREIVSSGLEGHRGLRLFYSAEEKARVAEAMAKMAIADLADQSYRNLSGGQQQRVLLARALCATKQLLIMDEPTAGLDPKVTAQMYDLIRELNREGITIIMVSHDVAAAVADASHILHVGHQVWYGSRTDYLAREAGRNGEKA